MDLLQQITKARGAGAALVAVATPDQQACARLCAQVATAEDTPAIAWDCVQGVYPLNQGGESAIGEIGRATGGMNPSDIIKWPDVAFALSKVTIQLVAVIHNAHRLIDGSDGSTFQAVQGIMNLRDPFGSAGSTLIMLCTSWPGTAELGSDVLVVRDELPGDNERRTAIAKLLESAVEQGARVADVDAAVESAVSMTRGLSRYAVEQTVALSLGRDGLDPEALRQRFVAAINETPGLTFFPDVISQDAIGGLDNFKDFARDLAGGRIRPGAVIVVDEIEKSLAGSGGGSSDTSGVSQAILGMLLSWMEDKRARGLIALGPPGSGKSMSSKALGSLLGSPTIHLDVGGFKDSLVGQSEANCRNALAKLEALAGPETFWVATCNSEAALPPELMARFSMGLWFFDLPDASERRAIWDIYLGKSGFALDTPVPDAEGWTGREIRACCENAWIMNTDPVRESQRIVPAALAKADQIERLRQSATGRCVSASSPGVYTFSKINAKAPASAGPRRMSF